MTLGVFTANNNKLYTIMSTILLYLLITNYNKNKNIYIDTKIQY